jgi:Ca-activated chloride channel homolog
VIALLAAVALALALAPPFRAEQPEVREGNERLAAGQPEAALRAYDRAEQAAGPGPEIAFDRGHALLRAGRVAEAIAAWRQAARGGDRSLASRAHQNVANALAAAGDRDGAIRACVDALRADPGNDDARFDLEVLQRREPPPEQKQDASRQGARGPERKQDAGGQDARGPEQKQDASRQGARGPERKQDAGGQEDARGPERKQDAGGQGEDEPDRARAGAKPSAPGTAPSPPPGAPPPARPGEPGKIDGPGERDELGRPGDADGPKETLRAPSAAPLSRQDAEALLDALRAREQRMPLGGARRQDSGRRGDAEKDW